MLEIERKFLIISEAFKIEASNSYQIIQGYLCTDKERTVRVRVKDQSAFLTIKGLGNETGMSRFEWEKKIDMTEAKALLNLCLPGIVNKRRYEVPYRNHIIEVDEFFDDNKGLLLAEIELNSEDEVIEKPNWLGREVTGNLRYYNSYLSEHPFTKW